MSEKLRTGLFRWTLRASSASEPRQARVGSLGVLVQLGEPLASWFPYGAAKSTLARKSTMLPSPGCPQPGEGF